MSGWSEWRDAAGDQVPDTGLRCHYRCEHAALGMVAEYRTIAAWPAAMPTTLTVTGPWGGVSVPVDWDWGVTIDFLKFEAAYVLGAWHEYIEALELLTAPKGVE